MFFPVYFFFLNAFASSTEFIGRKLFKHVEIYTHSSSVFSLSLLLSSSFFFSLLLSSSLFFLRNAILSFWEDEILVFTLWISTLSIEEAEKRKKRFDERRKKKRERKAPLSPAGKSRNHILKPKKNSVKKFTFFSRKEEKEKRKNFRFESQTPEE